MYEQAKQLRARLLATKRAIAEANHAIVGKILELDEIKAQIAFLNGLDVKEGRFVTTRYSETIETEVTAVIQKAQVLKEVEALQKQADALQDELDNFNATTFVEIEVD
jgi:small-conductance mechanosensitive channel